MRAGFLHLEYILVGSRPDELDEIIALGFECFPIILINLVFKALNEVGNILVGLTGYVGEVGRVPPSDIMPMLNQRVGRIIFKSNTFEPFIYAAMRLPEFKLFAESQSQGSAQANVSTKQLKEFRLIATENALIEKFNALTNSYFKKILNNFAESKTLAELRDTLLPKLMSGAMRLADAEREVEGAL